MPRKRTNHTRGCSLKWSLTVFDIIAQKNTRYPVGKGVQEGGKGRIFPLRVPNPGPGTVL